MFDLDSTGHVYMTDPSHQEMENEFYSRFDAAREMFSPAEEPGYQEEFESFVDAVINTDAQGITVTPSTRLVCSNTLTFPMCALCHEQEVAVGQKFCSACGSGEDYDDIPF